MIFDYFIKKQQKLIIFFRKDLFIPIRLFNNRVYILYLLKITLSIFTNDFSFLSLTLEEIIQLMNYQNIPLSPLFSINSNTDDKKIIGVGVFVGCIIFGFYWYVSGTPQIPMERPDAFPAAPDSFPGIPDEFPAAPDSFPGIIPDNSHIYISQMPNKVSFNLFKPITNTFYSLKLWKAKQDLKNAVNLEKEKRNHYNYLKKIRRDTLAYLDRISVAKQKAIKKYDSDFLDYYDVTQKFSKDSQEALRFKKKVDSSENVIKLIIEKEKKILKLYDILLSKIKTQKVEFKKSSYNSELFLLELKKIIIAYKKSM